MFDYDRSRKIGRKEFAQVISIKYFGDENESSKDRKKRIETTVNEVFNKYDTKKDGYLSLEEFAKWYADKPQEVLKIEKLFEIIDRKLTG